MSDSKKPQNENVKDMPTQAMLPMRDLWMNYLRAAGIGFVIGGIMVGIGFLTTWYQQLAYMTALGLWQNPWLIVLLIIFVALLIFVNRPGRNKQKKKP